MPQDILSNGPLFLQGDEVNNGPPNVPPNVPLKLVGDHVEPMNGWRAFPHPTKPGVTAVEVPHSADLGRVAPLAIMNHRQQMAFDNPYTKDGYTPADQWAHPVAQAPHGPVLEASDLLFNPGMAATPRADVTKPVSPTGIGSGSSAGTIVAIADTAKATGLSTKFLGAIANIESGGDAASGGPGAKYQGLYQLGKDEQDANGGGDRLNATDNAHAAGRNFIKLAAQFNNKYGRSPTSGELYLMHQQGAAGAFAHIGNPDGIAWQNVRKYFGSDAIAKSAIWGNVPTDVRKQFPGGVDTMTSRDFMSIWNAKVARFGAGDSPFGVA